MRLQKASQRAPQNAWRNMMNAMTMKIRDGLTVFGMATRGELYEEL